jgi:hypothetical protein
MNGNTEHERLDGNTEEDEHFEVTIEIGGPGQPTGELLGEILRLVLKHDQWSARCALEAALALLPKIM